MKCEYERWLRLCADPELSEELSEMSGNEERIKDAFYRHLEFGTGGLRGVLGAGTNRMNIYTVRRATVGLGGYLLKENASSTVAIGYDTRINSRKFAESAAAALAHLGIKVYIYTAPYPTPMLSYAVRELSCNAGIMITASHNPSQYNGYKVYGSDGCQITDGAASEILAEISKADYFGIETLSFDDYVESGNIEYIQKNFLDSFIERAQECSHLFGESADRDISIVYTPLNGTGYVPVTEILRRGGYKNVTVVREQAEPDGTFPTCPYPNPEIPEALSLGLDYAKRVCADLLIATDPDSDRVGVAARDGEKYRILSGNEVGVLLLNYIINQRKKHEKLPKSPISVKTVVTTGVSERIAKAAGVEMKNVLTGFKYIGEEIARLEAHGESERYIFGFEESCGYLAGIYVRDKDGVSAAYLVAEMAAYYKSKKKGLCERLSEIYGEYGYSVSALNSYAFPGAEGFSKMQGIMNSLRAAELNLSGFVPTKREDFSKGLYGLPKSNVLKFHFENATVTVRPSGTEPKLKIYIEAFGKDEAEARAISDALACAFDKLVSEN